MPPARVLQQSGKKKEQERKLKYSWCTLQHCVLLSLPFSLSLSLSDGRDHNQKVPDCHNIALGRDRHVSHHATPSTAQLAVVSIFMADKDTRLSPVVIFCSASALRPITWPAMGLPPIVSPYHQQPQQSFFNLRSQPCSVGIKGGKRKVTNRGPIDE